MNNSLVAAGISLQNQRKTNMDALLLANRIIAGEELLLVCVCDGVGSLEHGGIASSYAVNLLNEWFESLTEVGHIGLRLRDTVAALNRVIIDYARQNSIETASTLSALLIKNNSYYIVNIGDSRIYSVNSNTIEQLTVDDAAKSGALTAAIGFTKEPVFFYSEGTVDEKLFIVCSDGFYKRFDFMQDEIIINRSSLKSERDMEKALQKSMNKVIALGEGDNISAALARIAT